MKKILAATSFVLLSLCASPSYAKSLWLRCGGAEINLDTDRQQYNIEHLRTVYQGKASFFPNQISFEYRLLNDGYGGGLRTDYVIDRKTLEYTRTTMIKGILDRKWAPGNSTTGVCELIPNPTQGNKI